MNPLSLLNTLTEQVYLLLILITAYIISVIINRVSKKEISKIIINFIAMGMAGSLVVSTILMLITIYSYTAIVNSFVSSLANITSIHISETVSSLLSSLATTSLGASIILGIAILFIESERFASPLIKEIKNLNINNLEKVAIKLLDIVPFILSIIVVYSILFLAIFPTNMVLINTIIDTSQLYIYIIAFDIISSITVFVLNKIPELTNGQANYKNLLRNK